MDYHDHPAYSSSKIKSFATSTGLSYWARHEDPLRVPFLPSEPMRQGSLVDCLLTQEHKFLEKYAVIPEEAPKKPTKAQLGAKNQSLETVAAINWWSKWNLENQCKEVISREWESNAKNIAEVLRSDPEIAPLIECPSQSPHFWFDDQLSVDCRYMPDFENEDTVDLKQSNSANPRKFQGRAYFDFAYDIQCAHYREGRLSRSGSYPKRVILLAYEWKYPYNRSVNILSDEDLLEGYRRREEAILGIEECKKNNHWPSYGTVITKMPRHSYNLENENDLDELNLEGLE
jgi:exodeoxyribonuclease VIII